jgi:hypothetical protein
MLSGRDGARVSRGTATVVRDAALSFMDPNDALMVVDVTSDVAAWHGLSAQITNWIGGSL